ncbi:CIC11C00000005268 [Sungouiella intermedia]|uniref:MICOS complex subunit MIC60 n=1 Tax=Sungouiella intermedia TaxID=45354 RepID=A0A1L0FUQ5_9ASCO|nr:CIC11C00000005268 [[Candida] intermedia]
MIGSSLRRHAVSARYGSSRALVLTARLMQVKPSPTPAQPSKTPLAPKVVVKVPETPQQPPKDVKAKVQENNANPKNKKKFSFTGFLFKTFLVSSALYGATLYAATKSDTVMDFVIDKQLPYYEELIDIIENGSVDDLKKKWDSVSSNVQLPSKEKIEEITYKLEQQGEHLIEKTKKKFGGSHPQRESAKASGYITPTEQLQRPVEIETVSNVTEKLPQITLKEGPKSFADDTVKATILSFNELISLIDASSIGPQKDVLIKSINENINNLSAKLSSLNSSFEEELQAKLKKSQTELLSSYTQKELELTQNLLDQYNYEKTELDKKYLAKLSKEVDAAKEAISQAAVNATSMVRVEQTKRFEKMVKDKIDTERNGRLQNLENVNSRLEELEAFALSLENQITASSSKTLIQRSLSNVKSLLFNTKEETQAKLFKPYVQELEKSSSKADDEVISLALAELKPLLNGESSQSILTIPQLLTAWEQLTPELRSASLLPPNAGLLGHLASAIFSKLLLPVKGAKPQGKDIESVIGRVEQSLTRGDLDVAVEEVANLKGWTRKLADDWVREGRKRLEAEFLVSLIDTEAKIL